jgi:hypothetical protein
MPVVPQALAQERASRISDLKYDVALTIPAARTEMVRGTIVATFALTDTSTQLAFDFAQPADHLVSVTANRTAIEPRAANGHVIIPSRRLVKGENTIAIEFAAGDEALNRADDFCTRCSCRPVRRWPCPCSISRTSRRGGGCASICRRAGLRCRTGVRPARSQRPDGRA